MSWSTRPTAPSTRSAAMPSSSVTPSTPRTTWLASRPARPTSMGGGPTWSARASRSIRTASSSSVSTTWGAASVPRDPSPPTRPPAGPMVRASRSSPSRTGCTARHAWPTRWASSALPLSWAARWAACRPWPGATSIPSAWLTAWPLPRRRACRPRTSRSTKWRVVPSSPIPTSMADATTTTTPCLPMACRWRG